MNYIEISVSYVFALDKNHSLLFLSLLSVYVLKKKIKQIFVVMQLYTWAVAITFEDYIFLSILNLCNLCRYTTIQTYVYR